MSAEEGPKPVHDDQLAWEFETAARESMVMDRGSEIFRALGRQMIVRMAKHGINSPQGVEIAFESVLKDFMHDLSPFAQQRLLDYLIDYMPADSTDFRAGDPYINAAVASFGTDAIFKHIVRGVELSDPDQLILGMDDNYEASGSSS